MPVSMTAKISPRPQTKSKKSQCLQKHPVFTAFRQFQPEIQVTKLSVEKHKQPFYPSLVLPRADLRVPPPLQMSDFAAQGLCASPLRSHGGVLSKDFFLEVQIIPMGKEIISCTRI